MKFNVNLTEFKVSIALVVICILFNSLHAQIITETPPQKNEKDKKDMGPEKIAPSDTDIYFGVSPMYTFRTLVTNEGLFGEEVGDREQEFGSWVSSYGIGLRSGISKHFLLDFGFGVSRNREAFSINEPDSLFEYTSTYRQIAIPIQLGYTYGEEISFFMSLGLMPKAFLSQRKDILFRDQSGFEVEETEIIKNGYEQFLVDAIGRVGFRFQTSNKLGIYLMGEGFYQLSNNYTDQGPYIRRPFGIGLSMGFHIYL